MIGDNWTLEFVENMKFAIIGILVADLLGLYWYLKMKKLAIAILIVCIVFMALALYLERRKLDNMEELEEKPEKETKEEKKEEKKDKKEEKKEKKDDNLDFGFGDPEGYQERVQKGIDDALF